MRIILAPLVAFLILELSGALPVVKQKVDEPKEAEKVDTEKEKMQITSHQFDPYDPHTRTAWEEERRKKLELLRQYYNRERALETGMDLNPFRHHEDGDPAKLHAAEITEVKRAIHKLTQELAQMDEFRREIFKQYEMKKRLDEQRKEQEMDEEKRKQFHAEQERLREQHKKHEPLQHPGSKQQLEEVWEKQDHVEQEFDPEAFFNLHDVDSNGVWDQDEVSGLFQKELDKLYQEGLPEDDLFERREEMERMREHIFSEADTNGNGFIDFDEFIAQTKNPDNQKEENWKGIDEQQIFSQDEYDEYVRKQQLQLQQQPPQHQQQQHHGDLNPQYQQGQVPHPAQYGNQMPPQQQPYQGHQPMAGQHQQPVQYQPVPVQQHHYQVPQPQYQVPQNPPQVPPLHEQQYQHQPQLNIPVQTNGQQQQQNYQQQQYQQQPPPQQQQPNIPQQQHNTQQINGEIPPMIQNQAAEQPKLSPQQEPHSPNSIQPAEAHAVPAVVSHDKVV